jgi:hypothetical protein
MIHIPHLVIHHKWLVEEEKARHSMNKSVSMGFEERRSEEEVLTNAPGLCPIGLLSMGVLPPLLLPAACSAFRALCSANLFFNSAGDSNFGFFA